MMCGKFRFIPSKRFSGSKLDIVNAFGRSFFEIFINSKGYREKSEKILRKNRENLRNNGFQQNFYEIFVKHL